MNRFLFIISFIIIINYIDNKCIEPCIYGICVEDKCNCNSGYEGDICNKTLEMCVDSWFKTDLLKTQYIPQLSLTGSYFVKNNLAIKLYSPFVSDRLETIVKIKNSGPQCNYPGPNWYKKLQPCNDFIISNIPWNNTVTCDWNVTETKEEEKYASWLITILREKLKDPNGNELIRTIKSSIPIEIIFKKNIEIETTIQSNSTLNLVAALVHQEYIYQNNSAFIDLYTATQNPFRLKSGKLKGLPQDLDGTLYDISNSSLCEGQEYCVKKWRLWLDISSHICRLDGKYDFEFDLECGLLPGEDCLPQCTIKEEDVCQDCKNGKKITICHYPPGNPSNKHTIQINENALQTHLKHGDTIGACSNTICEENPNKNKIFLSTDLTSVDFCTIIQINIGLTGTIYSYTDNKYTIKKNSFNIEEKSYFQITLSVNDDIKITSFKIKDLFTQHEGTIKFLYKHGNITSLGKKSDVTIEDKAESILKFSMIMKKDFLDLEKVKRQNDFSVNIIIEVSYTEYEKKKSGSTFFSFRNFERRLSSIDEKQDKKIVYSLLLENNSGSLEYYINMSIDILMLLIYILIDLLLLYILGKFLQGYIYDKNDDGIEDIIGKAFEVEEGKTKKEIKVDKVEIKLEDQISDLIMEDMKNIYYTIIIVLCSAIIYNTSGMIPNAFNLVYHITNIETYYLLYNSTLFIIFTMIPVVQTAMLEVLIRLFQLTLEEYNIKTPTRIVYWVVGILQLLIAVGGLIALLISSLVLETRQDVPGTIMGFFLCVLNIVLVLILLGLSIYFMIGVITEKFDLKGKKRFYFIFIISTLVLFSMNTLLYGAMPITEPLIKLNMDYLKILFGIPVWISSIFISLTFFFFDFDIKIVKI